MECRVGGGQTCSSSCSTLVQLPPFREVVHYTKIRSSFQKSVLLSRVSGFRGLPLNCYEYAWHSLGFQGAIKMLHENPGVVVAYLFNAKHWCKGTTQPSNEVKQDAQTVCWWWRETACSKGKTLFPFYLRLITFLHVLFILRWKYWNNILFQACSMGESCFIFS
jgi:hypothetical protein